MGRGIFHVFEQGIGASRRTWGAGVVIYENSLTWWFNCAMF